MISRTRSTRSERTRRFLTNWDGRKVPVQGRQGVATSEYVKARRSTEQTLAKLVALQSLVRKTEGSTDGNGLSCIRVPDSTHIDELRAAIPPEVLEHYDYQRSRGRAAIASARGYVCRACFLLLPISSRPVLRAKKELYACDYCGAYLYLDEPATTQTMHASGAARHQNFHRGLRNG